MATTETSRIFKSGDANTLYVTIPAAVASDSQFPFEAEENVVVAIDDDRLIITSKSGVEEG